MGTLVDAKGNTTNLYPGNTNPGDPTKVRYAVYLDDQGRCIGVEDLSLERREITKLAPVEAKPAEAKPPIYEIWVRAKADKTAEAYNEYRLCYSFGRCFPC